MELTLIGLAAFCLCVFVWIGVLLQDGGPDRGSGGTSSCL